METDLLPAGVVTAIESDPRRPASVRVHTSAGTTFTVPADRVAALALTPGSALDPDRAAALAAAADEEAAVRAGLAALRRRAFASADLGRRLRRRGHPAVALREALARLERLGLLDDQRYAANYIETRAGRGRGPARLRRDLQALGIPAAIVDAAISARWPTGDADPAVPRALAERRARQLGTLPRPTKRRRLLAYLARRGFTGHSAQEAVTHVLAAEYQAS